jgi:dipeptidase E
MVVCPNIEYVTFMDDKSKAPLLNSDFTALHIVDFTVVPHCTDFPFKKSAEKILETYDGTLDLKPINNKQAVVVHGKSVQIVTA